MSEIEDNSSADRPMKDEQGDLGRQELVVKQKELNVRLREAERAAAIAGAPWWRRADPLVLAVIGAMFSLLGTVVVGHFNSATSIKQEEHKAANDLALERLKAKYTLILQAIATNDPQISGVSAIVRC
jgi:hypothetical protein